MRARWLLAALTLITATTAHASTRDDARKALANGVAQFNRGDARAARIELLNATRLDPEWALAHALAARVALALGDGLAANAALDRAISEGYDEDALLHLRLNAELLTGDARDIIDTDVPPTLPAVSQAYAHRIRARAAIQKNDFAMAAREFEAAVPLAPSSSLLWGDIGRFRVSTGNIAGAVEAAARAVALNPRNADALLLSGELVRNQFGLNAAIPWFDRVLALDRNNIAAMLQIAATYGDSGRTRDMLAMTRKILAIDPVNAQAWYLQAVLAARAGNFTLARSLLYRIDGRLDDLPGVMLLRAVLAMEERNSEQAIALLEDLVRLQPDNLRARRLLGTAMWRAGDSRAAIAILGPLAQRADADSYTLSVVGRAYEATGDRETAARYLERATIPARSTPLPFELGGDLARLAAVRAGNPDDAIVAVPRIASLITANRAPEALAEAERIRSLNPGAPAAHMLVGDALMALNRPADAARAYATSANIRFGEPVTLRLFAALKASNQRAAALRVLDLFLQQNPRSVPGLLLAADHFMESGEWDQAIGVLEGLRGRLGNRDTTILTSLGWAWLGKGDANRAASFGKAAYAVAPGSAAVADSYGWMLFQSGKDKASGLALMAKAVAIAPGHPGLRVRLARALIDSGRRAEATPHLEAALAITDPFAERDTARALLAGQSVATAIKTPAASTPDRRPAQ